MWFILVVPGLGLDVRCKMDDVIEESKGSIKRIYKRQELPDSILFIEWKDGTVEEFKLFDKLKIQLSSVLKTPITLVTKIIEPHKREYTKAVNAATTNNVCNAEEQNDDDDADEEEVENEEKINENDA